MARHDASKTQAFDHVQAIFDGPVFASLTGRLANDTFFAHLADTDAIMDLLIRERIDILIDDLELRQPPESVEALVQPLWPLFDFMTCERCAVDMILRYSGAATIEETGQISSTFARQGQIVASRLAAGLF